MRRETKSLRGILGAVQYAAGIIQAFWLVQVACGLHGCFGATHPVASLACCSVFGRTKGTRYACWAGTFFTADPEKPDGHCEKWRCKL